MSWRRGHNCDDSTAGGRNGGFGAVTAEALESDHFNRSWTCRIIIGMEIGIFSQGGAVTWRFKLCLSGVIWR